MSEPAELGGRVWPAWHWPLLGSLLVPGRIWREQVALSSLGIQGSFTFALFSHAGFVP
jgi:hypothetical protein